MNTSCMDGLFLIISIISTYSIIPFINWLIVKSLIKSSSSLDYDGIGLNIKKSKEKIEKKYLRDNKKNSSRRPKDSDNYSRRSRSKRKAKGNPNSNKDIPKRGEVSNIAGTSPIKALIKAVTTKEIIISLIFMGAIKRLVKFLLHISSKNSMLKPILVLNKKS